MSEVTSLVVMRLANMKKVHPSQDNSRVCGGCGHQVGIYPSGQRVLAQHPTCLIVCEVCATADNFTVTVLAPGAVSEQSESRPKETN